MAVRNKSDFQSNAIYFITFTVLDWEKRLTTEYSYSLIYKWFRYMREHYQNKIHGYVVMPNHIHMLISLQNQIKDSSLSTIIGSYKSGVSREVRQTIPGLDLWQRSFWDHVIRDERDLLMHSEYINANIDRWHKDKYFIKE